MIELVCAANGLGRSTRRSPWRSGRRTSSFATSPAKEENAIEVSVRDLEFLGSFVRARLDADALDGQTLEADLSINLTRARNLSPGQTLPIVLPRDHLLVYPIDGHG